MEISFHKRSDGDVKGLSKGGMVVKGAALVYDSCFYGRHVCDYCVPSRRKEKAKEEKKRSCYFRWLACVSIDPSHCGLKLISFSMQRRIIVSQPFNPRDIALCSARNNQLIRSMNWCKCEDFC